MFRYLLETPPEQYDSHWFPQYLQCQPCHVCLSFLLGTTENLTKIGFTPIQVQYSYIAKVETLAEDWEKIRTQVIQLILILRSRFSLLFLTLCTNFSLLIRFPPCLIFIS